MALLGAQLVITLVTVSVMQKLGIYYSFARWMFCGTGLIRYLYPTNAELKQLANISSKEGGQGDKGKSGGRNRRHGNTENGQIKSETFHVPRNIDLTLESCKVDRGDVIHLRYYQEYQWLIDFSMYAAIVYTLTELYQNFFPIDDEMNLSMMWCLLVIIFATKVLLTLTVQYFRGDESIGERSMCIVMGFVYLLIAMMVLIIDERTLELHLDEAYTSFNASATKLLDENSSLISSGPASKLVLKFFMALWCAVIGAVFTFPGLRVAKMHRDLLSFRFKDNKIAKFLLNFTMCLPFVAVCLWIKPISKDYLTVRIFSGLKAPLMDAAQFETLRLIIVLVTCFLHFAMLPMFLQSYLNMANQRVEVMKSEAGRILNTELQSKIAAVYYYACAVALQYCAPIIMCAFFTMMLKTLGDYNWTGVEPECSMEEPPTQAEDIVKQLRNVFGTSVMRGLLNFSTWWTMFAWFATTSVGLIYQSYFAKS